MANPRNCKHWREAGGGLMMCVSPRMFGPVGDRTPCPESHCLTCGLANVDSPPGEAPAVAVKPRMNFGELAAARARCREAKAAGRECHEFDAVPAAVAAGGVTEKPWAWAYGVTTCGSRLETLLPETLASLAAAGFAEPRLFVDGADDPKEVRRRLGKFDPRYAALKVTCRETPVLTHGNWVLGLWELFLRAPDSDAYAMFQDDLVMCRNVRPYLESLASVPENGYFNLFSFLNNEALVRAAPAAGFIEGSEVSGGETSLKYHGRPAQRGRGAVALVFTHKAVVSLLGCAHLAEHAVNPAVGWRNLDGAVVTAMNKSGFREYVHAPSLVQHTGVETSLDGPGMTDEHRAWRKQWISHSFPGEDFDALSLLG